MRRFLVTTIGAVSAALLTSPVMAAPCVTASVATYEASGFSCSVDGGAIVFSNITVGIVTSGTGVVTLGNFSPFAIGNEFGLSLNYAANTGTTAGSQADISWNYNVSANPPM